MSELELRHFRNLGVQELSFPPEGAAIIGKNAQGKTNLLEAIYYLESLRSFRGAPDEQLVTLSNTVFHVAGSMTSDGGGGETRLTAAFDRSQRKKKVTVDGTEAPRLVDGLGHLGAVVFSPGDVALVTEGPGTRRRFLDVVLSLNVDGYVTALQRYRKALAQRNACLKAGNVGAAIAVWDESLVQAGAVVIQERRDWVERWNEPFRTYYTMISQGEQAVLRYKDSLGEDQGQPLEDVFRDALAETREREERQRVTVVGPHRDDLVISLDRDDESLAARAYGSGGQQRTAALALRLVEAATIRDRKGVEPILLLDDAFAELDQGRSARIMELIDAEGSGQVILTAPKDSDMGFRQANLPRWGIEGGVVRA